MSARPHTSRLEQLPIRPRPRPGEPLESYVQRLARANHLKPSDLHDFLSGPPRYLGQLNIHRLAAVSGRDPAALERALTGISSTRRPAATGRRPRPEENRAARAELFAAIRRDGQRGEHSMRALAAMHHVHRRTIIQALASPTPPPRKPMTRTAKQVERIRGPVDTMLREDLDAPVQNRHTIRRIWQRLLNEHDIRASYSTVRSHVTNRRQEMGLPPTVTRAPRRPRPPSTSKPDYRQPPAHPLPDGIRSAIRQFAFSLANGTVAPDLLHGIDYRARLAESGIALETAFAVFTNTLDLDWRGSPANHAAAQHRAAQWIRAHNDLGYRPQPPFQSWEIELA